METAKMGAGWSSIERRLPLLICALLVPMVAALAVWSYFEVRRALLTSVVSRLEAGGRELADILSEAMDQHLKETQRLAADPAVVKFLAAPDDAAARDSLKARFEPGPRRSTAPVVMEVWSKDGLLLHRNTAPPATSSRPAPDLHAYVGPAPKEAGIRPPGAIGQNAFFETVAAAGSGDAVGYVVVRRGVTGGIRPSLLAKLISKNAAFMVGTPGSPTWTNLEGVMTAPPIDPGAPEQGLFAGADGRPRVGVAVPVGGTPWVMWVESDADEALAPARTLLMRTGFASLTLLVAGAIGAWLISRRIAAPLIEATGAAEAIAHGRFEGRLPVHRRDEVGRLNVAFNAMTAQIEEARRVLEERVTDRTRDLEDAMRRLRDTQDELVRNEKLAILGQLASGVGHELRNPLGVMTNAIYYLDMTLKDIPPDAREYFGILRNQINLSEKIIGDLLDFARTRSPQARPFALDGLAHEQVARLAPFAAKVVFEFPEGLPQVFADPVQAGQILLNLLTNAVQSIGDSAGTVTLRGRRLKDGRVALECSDTGDGVLPVNRAKIFEPLFTTRARGIGLGLSVSRRLAEANRGELRLADEHVGPGSTFVLILPAFEGSAG